MISFDSQDESIHKNGWTLKGGFRFCTKLGEYTTIVHSNILNTVALAILVASLKLTLNKHSKFDFFLRFHVIKETTVPSPLVFVTKEI